MSKLAMVIDGGLPGYDRMIKMAWDDVDVVFVSAVQPPTPSQQQVVAQADILIFGGGADIGPDLYGHTKQPGTYINAARDVVERAYFNLGRQHQRPMTGICRGAQFLWAMLGGTLYQDVDHDHYHPVRLTNGNEVMVNSIHHQLCSEIKAPSMVEVDAVAAQSSVLLYNSTRIVRETPDWTEIEAWGSRELKIFGVQYHPEGFSCPRGGIDLYFRLFQKYIIGE